MHMSALPPLLPACEDDGRGHAVGGGWQGVQSLTMIMYSVMFLAHFFIIADTWVIMDN